jgi:hypothetical protein
MCDEPTAISDKKDTESTFSTANLTGFKANRNVEIVPALVQLPVMSNHRIICKHQAPRDKSIAVSSSLNLDNYQGLIENDGRMNSTLFHLLGLNFIQKRIG